MDTGTAPKKTGKASPFGIPRRTVIIALTVVILAAVIFFLTAFSPFVTIPAGHTGIVTTFGRVEDYTLSEGFHLKSPLKQVIVMDTRTQRASLSMQAFSSDIQQVDVVCSVNYSVDRETCQKLYQRVGMNYYENVMEPRVLENVKTVFAGLEEESAVLVTEVPRVEQEIAGLKEDMSSVKAEIGRLNDRTAGVIIHLENVTDRGIKIIGEGHADLTRKLDEALKIENEKEILLLRMNYLEGELQMVKKRLSELEKTA